MKKIILVFLLIILPVFADEEVGTVYLDLKAGEEYGYKKFNTTISDLNIKQDDENNEDYIYHPLEYIKSEARELYFKKK